MTAINSDFKLRDQGLSNSSAAGDLPRHRWYYVKESFSPKLVEHAIATDGIDPGDRLLDPFSGSGTVPVVGAQSGLLTTAFELNPFLQFLGSTKSRRAPRGSLGGRETLLKALRMQVRSPLEGFSTFSKGNPLKRWLFPMSVLRAFEAGKRALRKVPANQRPFLLVALLGAAMDCCNATRDGKCLRYRKNWSRRQVTASRLRERFDQRVTEMIEDLEEAPLLTANARVVQGDARTLINSQQHKFHLCVTSPPYLNSFDYSDVYRPELFLGGFVRSNKDLMRIRVRTVRSHVQALWPHPKDADFGLLYQKSVSELRDQESTLWDPRIPLMIQAYFEDMKTILTRLRRRAATNASAWFVVSTSAYAGVEIPVDLILADIGRQAGWFLREIGVLRYLRSSGQQMQQLGKTPSRSGALRESVVIFDAMG